MRSQREIQRQLQQVTYRHLQKRLRRLFQQQPSTCLHNREVVLDDETHVRLCGHLSSNGLPRNLPCDERIPGCTQMAKGCPLWQPLIPKEQVKSEFRALVQSGDRGAVAVEFPDVAALMWVLDDAVDAHLIVDEPDPVAPRARWSWLSTLLGW